MIRIQSFATAKENAQKNNGYGNATTVTNTTTVISGVNGVRLWGQYHDHTQDIDGDMTGVGNVTSNGNIRTSGNIIGNQIQGTTVTSDHIVATDGNIGSLTGGTIHTTGSISTDSHLNATSCYLENELITEYLEATSANIGTLLSANLTCDNLTVTNAAHFFKLVIDEIKASKGQIIVTPANAVIDKVEIPETNKYNLYFRADDSTYQGKQIHNMFEVGDQVLCQTFDAATGTSYNVSNKFYWAKCIYVSSTPVDKLLNNKLVKCHMIQLDWTDKHSSTNAVPEAGDEVVMLGNRTDTTRQAAISIGAYNNPYLDNTIKAPFIIQYQGINDYNLSTHRGNVISNGYNSFKGVFTTTTGDNIEDLIDDVGQGAMTYMHTAYANSANGQTNFSKTYFNNALYMGFCSNHTQSDASLTYQDYTWVRIRGNNGTNATSFFLQSDILNIQVDENNESDTSDFYVYGYTFDNSNGKTQVNYNCKKTYVYPSSTYVQTQRLPILVSPVQEEQSFASGLKLIRFEMYDEDDENIVAQLEIPIIRDGESGFDGDDAEVYKLIPVQESCFIDADGKVGVKLSYNILRIVGTSYQYITTSSNGYHIGFKAHKTLSFPASYTYLPYNTSTPSYTNNNYATNWQTTQDHVEYLEVCLLFGQGDPQIIGDDDVIEKRIVYAQLAPSATFTITDEIKAVVQGHTTAINSLDGRITTNTNSISTIQQQYNQISSTVQSHTTSIDNLTGRVTQNETDISNITQRADSIESTVKNLKSGVKNYFNFTYCRWHNAVPFIQAYGIEGTGTLTRITKLGFDGVGGDFSVSCWMKMKNSATNVNVNLCDTQDTSQVTVNVTTTWKYYQFTFKDVQRYIGNAADTSNYNGFLDFESADISTTNRLYVREIMVVRGNIPCDFNYSWKDYESANTDNLLKWQYDQTIAKTNDQYKGYDIYSPTSYNTSDGEYTDYIFANNLTLKTNTPYTLSFYAKAERSLTIESFLFGNGGCVDGTCQIINSVSVPGDISIANFTDGCTVSKVGPQWKHYIIHWFNQNSGQRSVIVYRDSVDNWDDIDHTPNVQIAGCEFREGYWDENLLNSQSLIRQTATEIEMKVNNTGINIYDGSITLNAENTTIIGNLNLKDPKQGLIIYDEYDNPKITIQNETIGTLDNFDFGGDKFFKTRASSTVNSLTYNVSFQTITLGQFMAGQKLQLHDMEINTFNLEHVFNTPVTVSYNYVIKCGTIQIVQNNGTATATTFGYKVPDYTNNSLPYSGTYTIQMSITGVTTAAYLGNFNHNFNMYARLIQTNINKVATDGAVFASSTTQYNWMGSDQTYIRNGASAIRLKDGKIQRNTNTSNNPYYNTNFCDISSTIPYTIINALTYTATVNDGMIAFSTVIGQTDSTQRTMYLPNPSNCAGKQYFIKNMVGNNTQVYVSNQDSTKYFIAEDSTTTTDHISIGNKAMIFISCGLYWLTFYCG